MGIIDLVNTLSEVCFYKIAYLMFQYALYSLHRDRSFSQPLAPIELQKWHKYYRKITTEHKKP